jgi:hypothetical protein
VIVKVQPKIYDFDVYKKQIHEMNHPNLPNFKNYFFQIIKFLFKVPTTCSQEYRIIFILSYFHILFIAKFG